MTKRDEYGAKMKSQRDDMNAQLDKLAAKSKTAKKEMQVKYKQEMADLRAQSGKASAKLDDLKNADLVYERSRERCHFQVSWGFDDKAIWVDNGCRAEFLVN